MKGRYIGDNIKRLYDIVLYTEKKRTPELLLMIDFEKAFDSVVWSFILKALDRFNFGPDIKRWIKTFYTSPTSCVQSKDNAPKGVMYKRGVRQGDPCSPYLYWICADIVSILLRWNRRIKGITIKEKDLLLSQFVDDITVYLECEEYPTECIQTLEAFTLIAGLKGNNE